MTAQVAPAPAQAQRPQPAQALLAHLQPARHALDMATAIALEVAAHPQGRQLAGLQPLHREILGPLGQHLVAAVGAAGLLAAGQLRPGVFRTALESAVRATQLARQIPPALQAVARAAPPELHEALRALALWSDRIGPACAQAAGLLHATLPSWVRAQVLAELEQALQDPPPPVGAK